MLTVWPNATVDFAPAVSEVANANGVPNATVVFNRAVNEAANANGVPNASLYSTARSMRVLMRMAFRLLNTSYEMNILSKSCSRTMLYRHNKAHKLHRSKMLQSARSMETQDSFRQFRQMLARQLRSMAAHSKRTQAVSGSAASEPMLLLYQFRLVHQAQYSRSMRSSRIPRSRFVLTSCRSHQMRDSRTVLRHKSINSDRNENVLRSRR